MCWQSRKLERKIADKDIPVFKVGVLNEGLFQSMYQGFTYTLDTLYSTVVEIGYTSSFRDYEGTCGFHSYKSDKVKIVCTEDEWLAMCDRCQLDCEDLPGCVRANCIIPEGAIFFENEHGEIISNQIIIKELKPLTDESKKEELK